MGKIIYLDLNQVTLLGWERKKKLSKVEKMIENVKLGKEFPAVPIKEIDLNKYSLVVYYDDMYELDGGHHRAIAHYMANAPLKCELVEWGHPIIIGDGTVRDVLNIKDIILTLD